MDNPDCCKQCAFRFKPSRICKTCKNYDEAVSYWADYDELDFDDYEIIQDR